MEIRCANYNDIEKIMEILTSARAFQRHVGFKQWEDGYPSVDNIKSDIDSGGAVVLLVDDEVEGYAFLAIGDDAYELLPDIWSYKGDYGVIHRLAVSQHFRGKGLSGEILRLIENEYYRNGIRNIRVDTGLENVIMQKIMLNNGYRFKGTYDFVWGRRLVYEKSLDMDLILNNMYMKTKPVY